jgi:hypothetical protein
VEEVKLEQEQEPAQGPALVRALEKGQERERELEVVEAEAVAEELP